MVQRLLIQTLSLPYEFTEGSGIQEYPSAEQYPYLQLVPELSQELLTKRFSEIDELSLRLRGVLVKLALDKSNRVREVSN